MSVLVGKIPNSPSLGPTPARPKKLGTNECEIESFHFWRLSFLHTSTVPGPYRYVLLYVQYQVHSLTPFGVGGMSVPLFDFLHVATVYKRYWKSCTAPDYLQYALLSSLPCFYVFSSKT
jgi:hypothetical protein